MITMGEEFTKKAPFSTVYIHGLIRDEFGQKMSKSKGNTIDPVGIIDKYGCDALRFTLTSLCTYGGQDIKISDEKFEYGRNFANKIWNASRFVLMNLEGVDNKEIDFSKLTLADKWILNKLNETAKETNANIKDYRIGEMAHTLYDFFWNSYCDWYVEIAKIQLQNEDLKLNTQRVLRYVLDMTLRLLHPVMPHITEKIWQLLPKNTDVKAIMLEKYPVFEEKLVFADENTQMELVFETIKSLRNLRQSFNIPVSTKVNIEIIAGKSEEEIFKKVEAYIHRLAKVEDIKYVDENHKTLKQSASAVVSNSKIIVPLAGLIDLNEEIKRQNKKLDKLLNEKKSLLARTNNEKFMSNAKPELIEQTKNRIEEITVQENAINELINSLKG
jgi:valyl-tRNA synthetase